MTLEDFFTLKEMKDGLASIARVEELVSVIQNAKECPANTKSDTIRQWSTVASTLAATEQKECLNHFVLLNGLSLLNEWLQEATDPSTDTTGINAEEIIIALLASLEKLPIDKESAIASGIATVIKQRLDLKSPQIKEKAKTLLDKWKLGVDNVIDCIDMKEEETFQDDPPEPCEQSETNGSGVSSGNVVASINSCSVESNRECRARESSHTECDCQNFTGFPVIHQECTSNQVQLSTSSNCASANLEADNPPLTSPVLDSSISAANRVGSQEEPLLQSGMVGNSHNPSKVLSLKDNHDIAEEIDVEIPDGEETNGSHRDISSNSSTSVMPVSESPRVSNVKSAICDGLASKNTCSSQSKSVKPDCETQEVNGRLLKSETNNVPKLVGSAGKVLEERPATTGSICSEVPCKNGAFVGIENDSRGLNSQDDLKASTDNAITCTDSFLNIAETVGTDQGQKSELELVYSDDALEVARQVAIQVEREVVDYREPFCSSPDLNSGELAGSSGSDGKDDLQGVLKLGGVNSCEKEQHDASSSSKESSEITEILCSDPKNFEHVGSPLVNNLVSEPTAKPDIVKCVFDLNADVCSEEPEYLKSLTDEPVNVSAPVAIVASAKGLPLLPVAPSHFEEGLGWKGSAATSAFRPATSQKTLDSERAVSCTKHKTTFIDIDLNVAEGCDEEVEPRSVKQFPASSSLPSENSSVEVSSNKAERLHLDLNRAGDEDASMHPSGQFWLQRNGEHSLSSASSSSRRHSLIDLDLNDNPTFLDGDSFQNFGKSSSKITDMSVGSKVNDPVAMIMGSKIAVERKDYHMQLFPPNGLSMGHATFARPMMPYGQMGHVAYGYNGLPAGPTMSVPQAFYSPNSIPYMVDTRTQTGIPHVSGAGGFNAAASARPTFLMNVPTGPSPANLYGSFHPCYDLNSGLTLLDVGTKEGGTSKQLFLQGQNGLVQEQMKAAQQPSSSGSAVKRKEPETGWELYPYGYNQVTKWQQFVP